MLYEDDKAVIKMVNQNVNNRVLGTIEIYTPYKTMASTVASF